MSYSTSSRFFYPIYQEASQEEDGKNEIWIKVSEHYLCFTSLTKSKLPPFYMGSISFFFYQTKTDVIYNTRLQYFTCSYVVYCGKLLRQLPLSAIVMCVFFCAHSLHTATHKFHACNNTRSIRPFPIY